MSENHYMDMMKECMKGKISDIAKSSADGILLLHPDDNLCYHVSSRYDSIYDIPGDVKYIYLDEYHKHGFCAFRSDDMLVIINLFIIEDEFNVFSWYPFSFQTISWNGTSYNDAFVVPSDSSDICGQYNLRYVRNFPMSSRIEALSFFKGPLLNKDYILEDFTVSSSFSMEDIRSVVQRGMFSPSCCVDGWDLPQEVNSIIMDIHEEDICYFNDWHVPRSFMYSFCIIDYRNGQPVARFFYHAYLCDGNRLYMSDGFEYMRLCFSDLCSIPLKGMVANVIWIDERVKDMFPYLPVPSHQNRKYYGFDVYALILEDPLAGEVFSYDWETFCDFEDEAIEMSCNAGNASSTVFGVISKKGGLYKKLGVSKHVLDEIISRYKSTPTIIRHFKYMYVNHPGYLRNIDRDTFCKMFDCYECLCRIESCDDNGISGIRHLIDMYGPSGSLKYFIHVSHYNSSEQMVLSEYYRLLEKQEPSLSKVLPWDVEPSSARIMSEILDTDGIDYYCQCFRRNHRLWKQHEYHKGGFIICAPRTPFELFVEGSSLHHCVASFIHGCAENLTEILFLRKEDRPETPYFTLEVRDGELKQCHGFANSNVGPDLHTFLMEYCREKGLTLGCINAVYGA